MNIELPASLTIHDGAFALDGGTTHLSATDEAGKEHRILLIQHAFPRPDPPLQAIPGRMYFDGVIIAVRSAMEGTLLDLLRGASVQIKERPKAASQNRIAPNALVLGDDIKRVVQGSPEQNLREMLRAIVDYVGSEKYVSFAEKLEQMRTKKP